VYDDRLASAAPGLPLGEVQQRRLVLCQEMLDLVVADIAGLSQRLRQSLAELSARLEEMRAELAAIVAAIENDDNAAAD